MYKQGNELSYYSYPAERWCWVGSSGNGEKQLMIDEFERYYNLRVNGISDMGSERKRGEK